MANNNKYIHGKCIRCNGQAKLVSISAKCSDMFYSVGATGKEYDGYVPDWISSDMGEDYVALTICRHCGQVQGEWPGCDFVRDESGTPMERTEKANPFKHGKAS